MAPSMKAPVTKAKSSNHRSMAKLHSLRSTEKPLATRCRWELAVANRLPVTGAAMADAARLPAATTPPDHATAAAANYVVPKHGVLALPFAFQPMDGCRWNTWLGGKTEWNYPLW